MNGTKSILASRTFWGALLVILASFFNLLGYAISEDMQAEAGELIAGFTSLVGGVIALWGRVKATKKIGRRRAAADAAGRRLDEL